MWLGIRVGQWYDRKLTVSGVARNQGGPVVRQETYGQRCGSESGWASGTTGNIRSAMWLGIRVGQWYDRKHTVSDVARNQGGPVVRQETYGQRCGSESGWASGTTGNIRSAMWLGIRVGQWYDRKHTVSDVARNQGGPVVEVRQETYGQRCGSESGWASGVGTTGNIRSAMWLGIRVDQWYDRKHTVSGVARNQGGPVVRQETYGQRCGSESGRASGVGTTGNLRSVMWLGIRAGQWCRYDRKLTVSDVAWNQGGPVV